MAEESAGDDDEKANDGELQEAEAKEKKNMVDLVSYDFGEQITIVDGINQPLAHGCVLDDEPTVSIRGVEERWQKPGWWKRIKITTILPKCKTITIDEDHVYYADGDRISTKCDRTLKALMDVTYTSDVVGEEPHGDLEGFIIFHQWVVPRMRGAKRSEPPQGNSHKRTSRKKHPLYKRPVKKRRRA